MGDHSFHWILEFSGETKQHVKWTWQNECFRNYVVTEFQFQMSTLQCKQQHAPWVHHKCLHTVDLFRFILFFAYTHSLNLACLLAYSQPNPGLFGCESSLLLIHFVYFKTRFYSLRFLKGCCYYISTFWVIGFKYLNYINKFVPIVLHKLSATGAFLTSHLSPVTWRLLCTMFVLFNLFLTY